jgi:hypothetical protein
MQLMNGTMETIEKKKRLITGKKGSKRSHDTR